MWSAADVQGCFGSRAAEPLEQAVVACTLESLDRHGHLRGVVRLPDDVEVVCGVVAVREDGGADWLDFYLPIGALSRADERVDSFPFGEAGGEMSLTWRGLIDEWLAQVGRRVFDDVDFQLAVIGFEASGQVRASEIGDGRMPPAGLELPD